MWGTVQNGDVSLMVYIDTNLLLGTIHIHIAITDFQNDNKMIIILKLMCFVTSK